MTNQEVCDTWHPTEQVSHYRYWLGRLFVETPESTESRACWLSFALEEGLMDRKDQADIYNSKLLTKTVHVWTDR